MKRRASTSSMVLAFGEARPSLAPLRPKEEGFVEAALARRAVGSSRDHRRATFAPGGKEFNFGSLGTGAGVLCPASIAFQCRAVEGTIGAGVLGHSSSRPESGRQTVGASSTTRARGRLSTRGNDVYKRSIPLPPSFTPPIPLPPPSAQDLGEGEFPPLGFTAGYGARPRAVLARSPSGGGSPTPRSGLGSAHGQQALG